MPIKVQCACGKAFAAKDELAGKTVKCPSCQQALKIPGGAAPATAAAKPAAKAPAATAAAKPAAAKPAAAKPAAAPRPAPAAPAPQSADSLFDEVGLQKAAAGTQPCPGCMEPLPLNAVVCVKCGYNARIGRRMETVKVGMQAGEGGHGAVATDLLNRAAQVMDEDAAEEKKKTGEGVPWWVWLIGLCMLLGFGAMMLMLTLKSALFFAGVAVIVIAQMVNLYAFVRLVIVAFTESVVQGLLFLFVPLYSLFYIITRWDRCSAFFMMQLGAGVLVGIAFGLLKVSAMIEIKPEQQTWHRQPSMLVAQADADWRLRSP